MWSKMWSKLWRMMGRTLVTPAREAKANAIGIFALTLLLVTSASAAFALSESPAGRSSPAASAAPAPAPSTAAPAEPPATEVVPSDETEPPAAAPSEAGAAGATGATTRKRRTHHKSAKPPEVESANARLRVMHDGWIYAGPSKTSKKLEKATIGKFVDVTGNTKYYLQVKLKNGQTGYIAPSEVELVKPTDKIFVLSQDAAVLQAPNRWARKLAEVHRTHSVHVIGLALNYMQIRMKSGVSGFIPLTALQ
jgi:uncharacterized protein YgiM (DUF1202 family)